MSSFHRPAAAAMRRPRVAWLLLLPFRLSHPSSPRFFSVLYSIKTCHKSKSRKMPGFSSSIQEMKRRRRHQMFVIVRSEAPCPPACQPLATALRRGFGRAEPRVFGSVGQGGVFFSDGGGGGVATQSIRHQGNQGNGSVASVRRRHTKSHRRRREREWKATLSYFYCRAASEGSKHDSIRDVSHIELRSSLTGYRRTFIQVCATEPSLMRAYSSLLYSAASHLWVERQTPSNTTRSIPSSYSSLCRLAGIEMKRFFYNVDVKVEWALWPGGGIHWIWTRLLILLAPTVCLFVPRRSPWCLNKTPVWLLMRGRERGAVERTRSRTTHESFFFLNRNVKKKTDILWNFLPVTTCGFDHYMKKYLLKFPEFVGSVVWSLR